MSGFSAEWLALREPHDRAARSRPVLDALAAAFAGRFAVTVVDLACGTGSTWRAISSLLPERQNWRLVDNDLSLLGRAAGATAPAGAEIKTVPIDLARDLEAALDGPVDLVTASALLDLVSAEWLERFVVETAARRLPVYAALSYDGRAVLAPQDPGDIAVLAALNRHQLIDKGFGAALGPAAAATAIKRFEQTGYRVVQGTSDWVFGPADGDIQLQLIGGWALAAEQMGALSSAQLRDWRAHRVDFVVRGESTIRVGHVDFFAEPVPRR
jgi:SAM-dependent methyltransferase